jgi:MBG domain (YGX type)
MPGYLTLLRNLRRNRIDNRADRYVSDQQIRWVNIECTELERRVRRPCTHSGLLPFDVIRFTASLLFAIIVICGCPVAVSGANSVVFNSIPDVLAPDYLSDGFEFGHILEIGDRLSLAGTNRRLTSLTVGLSSWAKSEDFGNAASYTYPISLRIYRAGYLTSPGTLLATVNQLVTIPYRPSGWVSNGIAFTVTFDLSQFYIQVPDEVVYTVSINTSHFGTSPTGGSASQNYNSLGFAYATSGSACGGVRVGANNPGDIFDSRDSSKFYWDGTLPANFLRRDASSRLKSGSLTPLVQITADSYSLLPSSISMGGPSSFVYSGLPQGPTILSESGSTGSQTFVYLGAGNTSYGPSSAPPRSPGAYTATASVAGDVTHASATSSAYPFVINPAPLTISALPVVKPFGMSLTLGSGQTLFMATGLVNSESLGSVTLTASGGTNAGDLVGAYTLTPSAASGGSASLGNYVVTYQSAVLSVIPSGTTGGLLPSSIQVTGSSVRSYSGGRQGPTTATVSGSSGAVSYFYSGTGTTSYGTSLLAPILPGTYSVTATVASDATYSSAVSSAFPFSIQPALLTITAQNKTKVYGSILNLGTVQSGFSSTGLVAGQTVGSVTLTASGGTQAGDVVGSYNLVPSAASGGTFNPANYSLQYVNGTLTVLPVGSSIAVTGSTNFLYSGVGQGPTNVVLSGSSGAVTFSYASIDGTNYPANANAPTNAGSYTVTATVAADANYLGAVSAPYAFTVEAIPLTIVATDQRKRFGTSLDLNGPQTAFTANGLTNSETVDSVTLTASGGTQAGDPVGSYSLVPSGASGGTFNPANYSLQYFNGTLTVFRRASTVLQPTSISLTGETTYTYSGGPQGPTNVIVVGSTGAITLTYDGVGDTQYSSTIPPTLPGSYQATASVDPDTRFLGATSDPLAFTIQLAETADVPLFPPWGLLLLVTVLGISGSKCVLKNSPSAVRHPLR